MTPAYSVTAITPTDVRKADGSYEPAYDIHYVSHTEPPVIGTVTVSKSSMADPGAYADEVHAAITREVTAHKAVLSGPAQ